MKTLLDEKLSNLRWIVQYSDDLLSLYVSVEKLEENASITVDRLTLNMLLKEVIDPERLNSSLVGSLINAINSGEEVKHKKIARGQAPEKGADGKIDYLVKKCGDFERAVDNRFVHEIEGVLPGFIVARIHPPKEGVEGVDVFGQPLAAPMGSPARLSFSNSVALVEPALEGGPQYFQVKQSGFLFERDNRLTAQTELIIKGNVDLTVGNLDYLNKIQITEDVSKGFSVSGRRGIEIGGRTHGGSLVSSAGTIAVKGVLLGLEGDRAIASGKVEAKTIQNIIVEAGEQIVVSGDVLDSYLITYGSISMPAGHLVGREATALFGIDAGTIGTSGGSSLLLKGFSPSEIEQLIAETVTELSENAEALDQINLQLAPLLEADETLPALKSMQINSFNQLLLERDHLLCRESYLDKHLALLVEKRERPVFQVNYQETFHRDVVIEVGEARFVSESDLKGPGSIIFNPEIGTFRIEPLKALKGPTGGAEIERMVRELRGQTECDISEDDEETRTDDSTGALQPDKLPADSSQPLSSPQVVVAGDRASTGKADTAPANSEQTQLDELKPEEADKTADTLSSDRRPAKEAAGDTAQKEGSADTPVGKADTDVNTATECEAQAAEVLHNRSMIEASQLPVAPGLKERGPPEGAIEKIVCVEQPLIVETAIDATCSTVVLIDTVGPVELSDSSYPPPVAPPPPPIKPPQRQATTDGLSLRERVRNMRSLKGTVTFSEQND